MHFGQHLRAILEREKITQQRAGELLEMTQQAVSYYFRKPKPPRRDMLEFMVDRLGISLDELSGQAGVNQIIMRETPAGSGAHLEAGFMADLRREWQRHPARRPGIELAVRSLWPAARAEEVLTWLNLKP